MMRVGIYDTPNLVVIVASLIASAEFSLCVQTSCRDKWGRQKDGIDETAIVFFAISWTR